jgi:hypothetical protein
MKTTCQKGEMKIKMAFLDSGGRTKENETQPKNIFK